MKHLTICTLVFVVACGNDKSNSNPPPDGPTCVATGIACTTDDECCM